MAKEKRLIDANALLEKHVCYVHGEYGGCKLPAVFVPYIKGAPTVDAVEVVHGYWIDSYSVDHTGRITEHGIDCSVCDSVFKADRRDVVQHWKEQFKVCPFCGALMDGGNEDGR